MNSLRPERILIVKLGALGDVIMAAPLVRAIVEHHHPASTTLLTSPAFVPLFAAFPDLEVIGCERRGLRASLRALALIRGGGFRRVYDLQSNDRTAWWMALSGIRERVGNHPRFPYNHHPPERWTGDHHIFERMCEVLAAAGINRVSETAVPLLTADREHVDAWLRHRGLADAALVALHAGASPARPGKRWPHFAALAERLRAAGFTPLWLGADSEAETNAAAARATATVDATGAFSLTQLIALGSRVRFAVTNDSGPMHALASSGACVFGLFGPSDWRRNHAIGQASRVIACVTELPDCAGLQVADRLADLDVDRVWRRLEESGVLAPPGPD